MRSSLRNSEKRLWEKSPWWQYAEPAWINYGVGRKHGAKLARSLSFFLPRHFFVSAFRPRYQLSHICTQINARHQPISFADSHTTNGTRIHTCFSGGRRENRGAGQKNRFYVLFFMLFTNWAQNRADAINFVFISRNGIEIFCYIVNCNEENNAN